MCSVCSGFMMMCKGKNMFCLILEFTDNLDQWQVYKNLHDMIWHMRSQPQNFGIMAWMFLLYDMVHDHDKCIIFCMIWYDIWEFNPKIWGLRLGCMIWYMRNAAVYSWHFLLCLSQVPKLNLNHIKRISKLKQKLSNYVSFLQDMESLLLTAFSIFSQFSSF